MGHTILPSSCPLAATLMLSWEQRAAGLSAASQQQDLSARPQLQLALAEVGAELLLSLHGLSCSPGSKQGDERLRNSWLEIPSTLLGGISLLPGEARQLFPVSQGVSMTRRLRW